MKNLIIKEFKLSLHPTTFIFLSFAAMLLIPGYPYLVSYFYMCMSIFFICLTARETKDADFTVLLPVRKRDCVKARIFTASAMEAGQVILSVPFIAIKSALMPLPNPVGMDANTALLGFALAFFGIFNYFFFTSYYKNIAKVGKPFLWGSIGISMFTILVEVLTHAVPFMRDVIDTPDPQNIGYKLIFLAAGIIAFVGLTALAYQKSARSFEKQDL